MRSLLFPLAFCLAVSAASVSDAQAGVKDGSHWSGGGVDVAFDVGFTSGTNVTVQAITSSGWSSPTTGTPGDNHTNEVASCDTSGVMTVPTTNGVMQVRCKDGKAERFKNGKWLPMRRNFRMDMRGFPAGHTDGPGDETTSLPFWAVNEISYADYRAMHFQADPTAGRDARRN